MKDTLYPDSDADAADDGVRDDFPFRLRRVGEMIVTKIADSTTKRPFYEMDFEVVKRDMRVPNLPAAFEKYEIVHISDIHYGQWVSADRLNGVVAIINRCKPDLVAITGDFVSYSGRSIDELGDILRKLRPNDATVAVLGNHDHWFGASRIRSILRRANVVVLDNDVLAINRRGDATSAEAKLYVAGVDSVTAGKDRLEKVLQKLPDDGQAILLCHEPDFATISASTRRFILQLSGHSHGGQFIIPSIGTPVRGKNFWRYPHGEYRVKNMVQYTNKGIGTNNFWVRINAKPEITVITLHAD